MNGLTDAPAQAISYHCSPKAAPHREAQSYGLSAIGPEIKRKDVGRTAGSGSVNEPKVGLSCQPEELTPPHGGSIPKRSADASPSLGDASKSCDRLVCSFERETRAHAFAVDL